MWFYELVAAIIGLSGGMVVATALAAFIIGLGIIPRYCLLYTSPSPRD